MYCAFEHVYMERAQYQITILLLLLLLLLFTHTNIFKIKEVYAI